MLKEVLNLNPVGFLRLCLNVEAKNLSLPHIKIMLEF